jgi:exosortase D (VPLPA-CTERM-specific)
MPLGFAVVLFWIGELGGEYLTLFLSFWLATVGLCWIHLGWEKLRAIAFALVMILTMFPLPTFVYRNISVKLQLISTRIGVLMMRLYGTSAYREGNVIDLGFTQLQVVDACSGLRYFFPLIVLGLLLAYFFRGSLWKKAILVVSTLPLSILTNSLRIALTGILYENFGARVAEGFFHGFSGWFIFISSLAVLLLEMWVLKKIVPEGEVQGAMHKAQGLGLRTQGKDTENNSLVKNPSTTHVEPQTDKGLLALVKPPQFIVAVILLGTTLVFSQGINFREKIPIKRPFGEFPLQLEEWSGIRQTMDLEIVDTLDLSDYLIIDYQDPQGEQVNFYLAYYETQRKGESIHSPATCLPGSGWIFNDAGARNISVPGYYDGLMRVNRAVMQKLDHRQIAYYWFPQRGRILTNAYQLKVFAFWDALTKRRTDGALVRVITPVYETEGLEQAEARLQGFTRLIVPVLEEFIPGRNLE